MLRCQWFGCPQAIHGKDEATIGEISAAYPDWGFDGGIMLCSYHKRRDMPADVERAATLAWNEAIDAAFKACEARRVTASRKASAYGLGTDGHEKNETAAKAWRQAELEASFCMDVIRALKRPA